MHTTSVRQEGEKRKLARGRPRGPTSRRFANDPYQLGQDHFLHDFLSNGQHDHKRMPGAAVAAALLRDGATVADLLFLKGLATRDKRSHGFPPVLPLQPALSKGEARYAEWQRYVERKQKRTRGYYAPTDMSQLYRWLETSQPGQWCLYWEGYLPWDKHDETKAYSHGKDGEYRAVGAGDALWRAYVQGKVELYQARQGIGLYRYWAKRVNDMPIRERRR